MMRSHSLIYKINNQFFLAFKVHKLVIVRYFLSLPFLLLLGSCNFGTDAQETLLLKSDSVRQTANPNSPSRTSGLSSSKLKQEDLCLKNRRPLNPQSIPLASENALDRYFRLAYDTETEGNFDASITYYHKAAELSTCACDRSHARAGEQAAKEAKNLLKTDGFAGKPTQFFWNRLQELTESLSCVTIR